MRRIAVLCPLVMVVSAAVMWLFGYPIDLAIIYAVLIGAAVMVLGLIRRFVFGRSKAGRPGAADGQDDSWHAGDPRPTDEYLAQPSAPERARPGPTAYSDHYDPEGWLTPQEYAAIHASRSRND